jgi:hypothetical protein
VVHHESDGDKHCNVETAGNYKPRNPDYRNTYLARLSCDDERLNGTYWIELIKGGNLHFGISSRSIL